MAAAEAAEVKAYPNPFTEFFTVKLPKDAKGAHFVRIMDAGGRVIETYRTDKDLRVDASEYAAGVYLVQVERGDEMVGKAIRVMKR